MKFQLHSNFRPTGDQPQAIQALADNFNSNLRQQTLLGVTGSGKTFTVANLIAQTQKPTLVIAHNKTLAAQLYQELRDFFPNNAVTYFVSYYDYYQPEAYIPSTDTYIEKEAQINDEIDKLRLAATTNLMTRNDVIVVASVSCIYNLGNPVDYSQHVFELIVGEMIAQKTLLLQLTNLQYQLSDTDLRRGTYRVRGDSLQVWPAYSDHALKIDTLENKIVNIQEIDPISGQIIDDKTQWQIQTDHRGHYMLYPAKHYLVDANLQQQALINIEADLETRLAVLKQDDKPLEAYRLNRKVHYDLEMIREFGFVNGIENYSRYFDGRLEGQPPFTLIDYFHENVRRFHSDTFLTVIDESHISLPQIRGMYFGDRSRKETLIEYGFRLPSALDNRPLTFEEFLQATPSRLYVSATPGEWELKACQGKVVEQLVRPTGLLDPVIRLRSTQNQIQDLAIEIMRRFHKGERTLVTTLTKRMAEDLTEYLNDEKKIRALLSTAPTTPINHFGESQLPISSMNVGPIDQQFYSKAFWQDDDPQAPVDWASTPLPKIAYLHSEVETLDRSDILDDLRAGAYDVLVGINLLREGLDLPEVSLVAILDADKTGFLRSATSLIQTMGRAARHQQGEVILYADFLSEAMQKAISETQRRRQIQLQYNQAYQITPTSIHKPIREKLLKREKDSNQGLFPNSSSIIQLSASKQIDLAKIDPDALTPQAKNQLVTQLTKKMHQAAKDMNFELAVILRDTLKKLS